MIDVLPQRHAHFVLVIGDDGVTLAPFRLAHAPVLTALNGDRKSIADILALRARHANIPVTLLIDTTAQDLRRETIPPLGFLDRAKFIRRMLREAFPHTALTAARPSRAEPTQVLLAGVSENGTLAAWLARLAEIPGAPPRLALLPVESAALAARLLPESAEWRLLVSLQRGGFRQIVTQKNEIVFSRLTPAPAPSDTRDFTDTLRRDMQATRDYLGRCGLTAATPLHAALLMPEALHTALRAAELPAHALKILSPRAAAAHLGLSATVDDDRAEQLHAAWFATHPPRLAFRPPAAESAHRQQQIRAWGMRAAATAMIAALGVTGWQASGLAELLRARHHEAAQVTALEKKLALAQTAAGPVTAPLGKLRAAVARQRLFSAETVAPWKILTALGGSLGADIRAAKIEWRNGEDGENLRAELRDLSVTETTDREAATARFRDLASRLAAAMPAYNVSVARYPFPALPQEVVSNSGAAQHAAAPTADFVLTPKPGGAP